METLSNALGIRRIMRFLSVVIPFSLVTAMSYFISTISIKDEMVSTDFNMNAYYVCACILFFLFFNSMVRIKNVCDETTRKKYYKSRAKVDGLLSKIKFVLSSPLLWIEAVAYSAFYWFIPFKVSSLFFVDSIFDGNDSNQNKLIFFGIAFTVLLIINLYASVSAINVWKYEDFEEDMKVNNRIYLKQMLITLALYCFGISTFSLIFALISNLLPALSEVITIKNLLILICVILLFMFFRYIRAVNKRRKFLYETNRFCKENGFKLHEMRNAYKSILFLSDSYNMVIEANGKTYFCKFLCGMRKKNSIVLDKNGKGEIIHTFSFRDMKIFEYSKRFRYDFEANGVKSLLIIPVPNFVYIKDAIGRRSEADNGDKIGDYCIFNGKPFLNSIERKTI